MCITPQHLHEASALENLRARYRGDDAGFHTLTAYILTVVNPYKVPDGVYGREEMERYEGKALGRLPPHIYGVADRAYRMMVASGRSQSCVVSGDSVRLCGVAIRALLLTLTLI